MIGFQGSTFWLTCKLVKQLHLIFKLVGTNLSFFRLHAGYSGTAFPYNGSPPCPNDPWWDHVEYISRKNPPPCQQHPNHGVWICWIYYCRSSVCFHETGQSLLGLQVSWNDSYCCWRRSPEQCRKCRLMSLNFPIHHDGIELCFVSTTLRFADICHAVIAAPTTVTGRRHSQCCNQTWLLGSNGNYNSCIYFGSTLSRECNRTHAPVQQDIFNLCCFLWGWCYVRPFYETRNTGGLREAGSQRAPVLILWRADDAVTDETIEDPSKLENDSTIL